MKHPGQAIKTFESLFRDGDLIGLMDLHEENAVFTNARGAFVGLSAIREVLQGYLDSGVDLTMNDSVVVESGELALV